MQSIYYLNTNEINNEFLNSLKTLFSGKNIQITVTEVPDETDYLLSNKANSKRLLKSVENINKGLGLKELDLEQLKRL
jgi:hypothetical protein